MTYCAQHEPDHILLEATRNDAATGLLDIGRSAPCSSGSRAISPIAGSIRSRRLPSGMLEIGRESVHGEAQDFLLTEAADDLINEADERPR